MKRSFALTALLVGLLESVAVAAPRPRDIHVLQLASSAADTTKAIALTHGLERWLLQSSHEHLVPLNRSLVQVLRVASCGERFVERATTQRPAPLDATSDRLLDGACLEKLSLVIDSPSPERYLWGWLHTDPSGQAMATLHLWQRGQLDRVATVPFSEKASDLVANRLYTHLFETRSTGDVRLPVTGEVSGSLFVDGGFVGQFDAAVPEATVVAGRHRFEVRTATRGTWVAEGEVMAGQTATCPLVAASGAAKEASHAEHGGESGSWKLPVGITATSVGAVALAAGVFANSRVSSFNDDLKNKPDFAAYRAGIDKASHVCPEAEKGTASSQAGAAAPKVVDDACSSASMWKGLRPVFFIAGGALAAGGLYLMFSSFGHHEHAATAKTTPRRWALVPAVSSSDAGASLHIRW